MQLNSFYKATIIINDNDNDTIRKENFRSTFQKNIDAKILSNRVAN